MESISTESDDLFMLITTGAQTQNLECVDKSCNTNFENKGYVNKGIQVINTHMTKNLNDSQVQTALLSTKDSSIQVQDEFVLKTFSDFSCQVFNLAPKIPEFINSFGAIEEGMSEIANIHQESFCYETCAEKEFGIFSNQ